MAAGPAGKAAACRGPIMRILIVDDENDARELLGTAFAAWGFSVEEAGNGAQALELARRTPPDLILSDLMMPEMDGFVLCRSVKQDAALREVPFVLYTATRAEAGEDELAARLGAARLLHKPLELEELRAAVLAELRRPRDGKPAAPEAGADPRLDRDYMEILSAKLREKSRALEEALARLASSEEMYRRLVENTPDIVYLRSSDRGLLYCSPRAGATLGHTAAFLTENPYFWLASVHPEDRPRAEAAFAAGGASRCVDVEYRIRTAAGAWRWFRDKAVCRPGPGGEVLFDGIASDVTARKEAEQRLMESQARLFEAQKLELVGRLSGGVAHDLNNLLGPVLGYADSLAASLPPGDLRQFELGEIRRSAARAARLVRQLTAFSRTQLLAPELLELNPAVESLAARLRGGLGEGHSLSLRLDPRAGFVMMDPAQLELAVTSLVAAASEATPGGGEIALGTGTCAVPPSPDLASGGCAVLTVRDSRPGLSPAEREHIFEPFFSTRNPGSGMRYPTVLGIVKQSGGEVMVDSAPGRGAVFSIYLPSAGRGQAPGAAPAEEKMSRA